MKRISAGPRKARTGMSVKLKITLWFTAFMTIISAICLMLILTIDSPVSYTHLNRLPQIIQYFGGAPLYCLMPWLVTNWWTITTAPPIRFTTAAAVYGPSPVLRFFVNAALVPHMICLLYTSRCV